MANSEVTFVDHVTQITAANLNALKNVYFKVKNFGAVGNGSTDDTTAINDAIAAAVAAGGGIVLFDALTYLVNGLAVTGNNVHLMGTGWGTILKQPTGLADNTWLLSAFGSGTGVSTNIFNLRISDLQLLGRSDTDAFTQYVHLIDIAGVSDVVIERCFFSTWRGDAINLASNNNAGTQVERHNERVTIRNCKFDGEPGGSAPYNTRNAITVTDGTDVLIENCFFTHCASATMPGAIDIEPNTNAYHRIRNIRINGNTFEQVGGNAGVIGMFLNQAQTAYTLPMRGLQVTHNTIRNCTNTTGAFFFNQVQTPTVTTERNEILVADNVVLDGAAGIGEAWGIRGLRFERNYCNTTESSLAIGYGTKCMDVYVFRNDFQKIGSVGGTCIDIYTVDRLRIEGNVFDNIGDQAGTGRLTSFGAGSGGASTSTEVEFIYNRAIGTQATVVSNKAGAHTLSVDTNAYYGNDTLALVPPAGQWAMNETLIGQPVVTITYSASMTPDASLGVYQKITATNGTAMTINAPTAPVTGARLILDFLNSSGGTMGAVTFNAAFKPAGALTVPANTKRRTIEFVYDGTNWVEINRAGADI